MRRLVLALVACAAPPPAAPLPELPVSPAGVPRATLASQLAAIGAIADRACACHDEACDQGVERDLAGFYATITDNDPMTDIETWPSDLDALLHANQTRITACFTEQGFHSHAVIAIEVRKLQLLSKEACACTDLTCARHATDRLQKWLPALEHATADEKATMVKDATAVQRCTHAIVRDQAVLDMKAIRTHACACTDRACTDEAAKRYNAWREDYAHDMIDTATVDRIKDDAAAALQCLRGGRP